MQTSMQCVGNLTLIKQQRQLTLPPSPVVETWLLIVLVAKMQILITTNNAIQLLCQNASIITNISPLSFSLLSPSLSLSLSSSGLSMSLGIGFLFGSQFLAVEYMRLCEDDTHSCNGKRFCLWW